MKILLVHLSDIHFKPQNNIVSSRVEQIVSAVQSVEPEVKDFFVTMTGDVAYAGSAEEYTVANGFFDMFHLGLLESRPDARVEEIFIPGNHDCQLVPLNKMRALAMNAILTNPSPPYSGDPDYIEQCVLAQDEFFKFRGGRERKTPLQGLHRLFFQHRYEVGDYTVRFDCYNSAWLSALHEEQGKLLIPTNLGTESHFPNESGAVVSIFHHPYGWLDANNAREFSRQIEERSDIVMTGHEHVGDQQQRRDLKGSVHEYFAGEVLQEGNQPQSGFYVLVLDLKAKVRKIWKFEWDKDAYHITQEGVWDTFERTDNDRRIGLQISDEFHHYLNDIGMPFRHPRKDVIKLRDIYMYPAFDEINYGKKKSTDFFLRETPGDTLLDYVLKEKSVLFFGEDRSGKTSLAKNLYYDLYNKGYIPVFLDGRDLKSPTMEGLKASVNAALKVQYNTTSLEKYHQCPLNKKVVIVDNLHLVPLSPKGKSVVLEHLKVITSLQIVIASDIVQLKALLHTDEEENALYSFKHCNIREFSMRSRGQLIERWFELGQEFSDEEDKIAHDIIHTEQTITAILGKNVIPSLPFFILTLLQVHDWDTAKDAQYGAHGYYYEALITQTLQATSTSIHVDILYPLTSRIASFMHENRLIRVDNEQFNQLCQEYKDDYHVPLSEEAAKKALVESRIMASDGNGGLTFQYSHLRNYFTARFLKDNLQIGSEERKQRERISRLIENIHLEENTNILVFFVYLVKDEAIIREIVAKARGIFSGFPPMDLVRDIKFVDKFNNTSNAHLLELADGSEKEKRDRFREEIDRLTVNGSEPDEHMLQAVEAKELDAFQQFNVAFKTLQILGQILRNFPGTLLGRDKIEITQECYLLGLRAMRVVFGLTENDSESIRAYLGQIFQEQHNLPTATSEDRKKLESRIDAFCFHVLWNTAQIFLKRISTAVGAEHLSSIYLSIPKDSSPLAIDMINVTIKLDHFKAFPETDVMKVWDQVEDTPFTRQIIRSMVYDRLRLFPSSLDLRQRICKTLDIKPDAKIIIGSQTNKPKQLR